MRPRGDAYSRTTVSRLLLTTVVAAGLASGDARAEHADPLRESIARDLRIGFLVASGDVLLPIEETGDPVARFSDSGSYRDRDERRRRWGRRLEENPRALAEVSLRLPPRAEVTVFHNGLAHVAVVSGFDSLGAGCGEAEPVWRLQVAGTGVSGAGNARDVPRESRRQRTPPRADRERPDSRGPAPWQPTEWNREDASLPVLVDVGDRPAIQPPAPAVRRELPAGLLLRLAEADLLEGENRSLRAGPVWAIYGARTFDAQGRTAGSIRSIWLAADGAYRLLHWTATNPDFEEMIRIDRWTDEAHHRSRANAAVGQIHASFNRDGRLFLLIRTRGWESDGVRLEELRDGTLQTVLVDGLDRGC